MNLFKNSVNISKDICRKTINKGDIVVDATMGNGNDTEFLSSLVGENGKVYAFDIQKEAVENTRAKLEEKKLIDRVILINDGHENIKKYINEPVSLVLFNLGYLPKGDHNITTKANSTLEAVKNSMELLKKEGLILIVIYHGHDEGKNEKNSLDEFSKTISQKEFNVAKLKFMNQINQPPELLVIEKR
ncbi:class I SAM-dependent methyltransferase [Clostridium sediminicola]|uniref:tRNA (mnm(5)s(2)U34)-methyltransferase n=1 Tax=Clostridium sediminicola TaxID=3114879 RepID=UPI0031F20566